MLIRAYCFIDIILRTNSSIGIKVASNKVLLTIMSFYDNILLISKLEMFKFLLLLRTSSLYPI